MLTMSLAHQVHISHLFSHETKRLTLVKFALVLSVFVLYFLYISYKFGIKQGFLVALLSWSFFVLSTPIADAGFLFDFPIRLILNIKMWLSELFVWLFAIALNLYVFFVNPQLYQSTALLKIFYILLSNPWPYWSIIFLSALGTFLSVYFADEMIDTTFHKDRVKYKRHRRLYLLVAMVFLFSFVFFFYYELLGSLGLTSLKNLL